MGMQPWAPIQKLEEGERYGTSGHNLRPRIQGLVEL
jgi:hypothetical protein